LEAFGISSMFLGPANWTWKLICFLAIPLNTKKAYYPTDDIQVLK
jgi:hypothetical protein